MKMFGVEFPKLGSVKECMPSDLEHIAQDLRESLPGVPATLRMDKEGESLFGDGRRYAVIVVGTYDGEAHFLSFRLSPEVPRIVP